MVQYAVIRGSLGWDVFADGARRKRHATRLTAIEFAYFAALAAEQLGEPSELLVQDEGGQLERWAVQAWPGVQSPLASVLV